MPDSGFQTLSVQHGFRITIVKWNPESLSCFPNFNAHDSGIQNQTFPGFRIRQAKISRIPEPGCLFMGRGVITTDR